MRIPFMRFGHLLPLVDSPDNVGVIFNHCVSLDGYMFVTDPDKPFYSATSVEDWKPHEPK